MKVAIVGYGKMGKGLASLMPKDWELSLVCDVDNPLLQAPKDQISSIDVFFEFTEPKISKENITFICETKKGAKIVCGTTGWNVSEVKDTVLRTKSLLLYSANFSLGINVLNNLLGALSSSLTSKNGFETSITEIHHVHKKDIPSGTAKLLASTIEEKGQKCPITSIREGEYPGTHIIQFKSEFETVEIKHEVSSRQVFCAGAILSAKWLMEQKGPGIYSFNDVIGGRS